jgi:hypothetical protein
MMNSAQLALAFWRQEVTIFCRRLTMSFMCLLALREALANAGRVQPLLPFSVSRETGVFHGKLRLPLQLYQQDCLSRL